MRGMKMAKGAATLVLASWMLSGCPQPEVELPDAFRAADAFVPMDSGADPDAPATPDAPSEPDAFIPPDATFDAGPPDAAGPACTTPGSMRRQPCSCGYTRIETCIDGNWRTSEACNYTAVACEPGTTRPVSFRCSVGIQRCTEGCAWAPAEYTTPMGECTAGNRCAGSECICRADCTCPLKGDGGECLP